MLCGRSKSRRAKAFRAVGDPAAIRTTLQFDNSRLGPNESIVVMAGNLPAHRRTCARAMATRSVSDQGVIPGDEPKRCASWVSTA